MTPPNTIVVPPNAMEVIREFISNGLYELANAKIKQWNLKLKIENGTIVDISNSTEAWLARFITKNALMMELKDEVRKLSKVDDEVLIHGATGVGKELIAHALHGDREGKFVAVNCAGLPENLIESELFGHRAGSFTGAIKTKQGLMAVANKGTLFLDEIGELPMSVQAKFLRAIQEKKVRKVGGDEDEEITCRIVAATNRNLDEMVNKDVFRIDLLARLSVFNLFILPLKDRTEDIFPIIASLPGGKEFIEAAKSLESMDVSFNVRSLQSHVKRFKVLGKLPSKRV